MQISYTSNLVEQNEIINFGKKEPDLTGDLSIVTIENLMQLMGHAWLSGEIQLEAPDNKAGFIIRDGILIFGFVQYNVPRIGKRLIDAGFITKENLNECLTFYQEKQTKLRLGEILITHNYVSSDTIEELIKEQIKDCFFNVLKWKEGRFSFYANESPHHEEILLAERIDHLTMEGIIAMDNNN